MTATAFKAGTPAQEVKQHRQVRLVGELIRPPWWTDIGDDLVFTLKTDGVFKPRVRPPGERVGWVYAVISRGRDARYHVALYDQTQEPVPGHYLIEGRVVCHCRAAETSKGRRRCWHADLTWERRGEV